MEMNRLRANVTNGHVKVTHPIPACWSDEERTRPVCLSRWRLRRIITER